MTGIGMSEVGLDAISDRLREPWKRGAFRVEREDRPPVHLEVGELYVVARGERHRPVADAGPAIALLIKRNETKQHGAEAGA